MKSSHLIEKNLAANEYSSIGEVLVMITDNQRGAVAVVDDDFVYLGMVSDGEIRRALVHGATQFAPISKIVNMNAKTLHANDRDNAETIFVQFPEVTLIPIIGEGNILVDIIVRDSSRRKD